jgi:hypothetical protein
MLGCEEEGVFLAKVPPNTKVIVTHQDGSILAVRANGSYTYPQLWGIDDKSPQYRFPDQPMDALVFKLGDKVEAFRKAEPGAKVLHVIKNTSGKMQELRIYQNGLKATYAKYGNYKNQGERIIILKVVVLPIRKPSSR